MREVGLRNHQSLLLVFCPDTVTVGGPDKPGQRSLRDCSEAALQRSSDFLASYRLLKSCPAHSGFAPSAATAACLGSPVASTASSKAFCCLQSIWWYVIQSLTTQKGPSR